MEKERIRTLILDARETLAKTNSFPRELTLDHEFLKKTGKIAAIVGPRRAGKSVFLRQVPTQLQKPLNQTLWVDFSEVVWADFRPDDWQNLWTAALELGCGEAPLFLLDEIQEVPEFAAGLRFLQNQGALLYITGSNSTVFGENLAGSLRGKVLTYPLFPLSFNEFLLFRGIRPEVGPRSTAQKAHRRVLWEEYLTWGGFPEVVLADRLELKRSLLESYLDVMLFRDVIERHNVKNFVVIEKLFTKILLSFTKEISVHRWYNELRSQGLKVGKDTLYEYLGHFEEALFVRQVTNAAAPNGHKKVYLVDNGLYQRVRDRPDWGKLWENQCFVDLWRQNETIQFWKSDLGEVDFVTQDRLIQVTVELSATNRDREESPLKTLAERYPNHAPTILTLDES